MVNSSERHRARLTWFSGALWSSNTQGRSQELRPLIFTAVAGESGRCSLLGCVLDVRRHALLLSPSLGALALHHCSRAHVQ